MRSARSFPARVGAVGLVSALLLSGCGNSSDTASAPTSSAAAAKTNGTVTVTGGDAKTAPKVVLSTMPYTTDKTVTSVVKAGTGATVTAKNIVSVDLALINGKDGKVATSSYGQSPQSFNLSDAALLPGIKNGLIGQKVGSQVAVSVPPADAFGSTGSPDLGIGATDTIVMVMDIRSASEPLTEATGAAVAPKAGLPTVKMNPGAAATITSPKTTAPTALVVQPLITGTGAEVKAGQNITVAYTGALWKDNKVFDYSAKSSPTGVSFPIGVGSVIPGWDKGLVGQKIGSRVLLVIPPADGYGAAGSAGAGITGTDTLVFVVDILAAA